MDAPPSGKSARPCHPEKQTAVVLPSFIIYVQHRVEASPLCGVAGI